VHLPPHAGGGDHETYDDRHQWARVHIRNSHSGQNQRPTSCRSAKQLYAFGHDEANIVLGC
jgi:hypothetical protein